MLAKTIRQAETAGGMTTLGDFGLHDQVCKGATARHGKGTPAVDVLSPGLPSD